MENEEIEKIENDKFYRGDVIKQLFESAKHKVLLNPIGDTSKLTEETQEKLKDGQFNFSMMLSGMVLFNELDKHLFKEEDKK